MTDIKHYSFRRYLKKLNASEPTSKLFDRQMLSLQTFREPKKEYTIEEANPFIMRSSISLKLIEKSKKEKVLMYPVNVDVEQELISTLTKKIYESSYVSLFIEVDKIKNIENNENNVDFLMTILLNRNINSTFYKKLLTFLFSKINSQKNLFDEIYFICKRIFPLISIVNQYSHILNKFIELNMIDAETYCKLYDENLFILFPEVKEDEKTEDSNLTIGEKFKKYINVLSKQLTYDIMTRILMTDPTQKAYVPPKTKNFDLYANFLKSSWFNTIDFQKYLQSTYFANYISYFKNTSSIQKDDDDDIELTYDIDESDDENEKDEEKIDVEEEKEDEDEEVVDVVMNTLNRLIQKTTNLLQKKDIQTNIFTSTLSEKERKDIIRRFRHLDEYYKSQIEKTPLLSSLMLTKNNKGKTIVNEKFKLRKVDDNVLLFIKNEMDKNSKLIETNKKEYTKLFFEKFFIPYMKTYLEYLIKNKSKNIDEDIQQFNNSKFYPMIIYLTDFMKQKYSCSLFNRFNKYKKFIESIDFEEEDDDIDYELLINKEKEINRKYINYVVRSIHNLKIYYTTILTQLKEKENIYNKHSVKQQEKQLDDVNICTFVFLKLIDEQLFFDIFDNDSDFMNFMNNFPNIITENKLNLTLKQQIEGKYSLNYIPVIEEEKKKEKKEEDENVFELKDDDETISLNEEKEKEDEFVEFEDEDFGDDD